MAKKKNIPRKVQWLQQQNAQTAEDTPEVKAPVTETPVVDEAKSEPGTPVQTPETLVETKVETPAPKSEPETAPLNETDKAIAEQEQKDIEDTITRNETDIKGKEDPVKDTLEEANLSRRAAMNAYLNYLEADRQEYRKRTEQEQRDARKKTILGGITEAVNAVSGLIGASKGATPVKPTNYTSKWMEEADKLKKESQARYDNDRQKRRQAKLDAINAEIAMKQGMAEYENKRRKEKENLEITRQQNAWKQYQDERKNALDVYNAETNRVKAGNDAAYKQSTMEERERHNRAMEGNSAYRVSVSDRNNERRATETERHNRANEAIAGQKAAETVRHNQARESQYQWAPPAESTEVKSDVTTPLAPPEETPAAKPPENTGGNMDRKEKTAKAQSSLDKYNK